MGIERPITRDEAQQIVTHAKALDLPNMRKLDDNEREIVHIAAKLLLGKDEKSKEIFNKKSIQTLAGNQWLADVKSRIVVYKNPFKELWEGFLSFIGYRTNSTQLVRECKAITIKLPDTEPPASVQPKAGPGASASAGQTVSALTRSRIAAAANAPLAASTGAQTPASAASSISIQTPATPSQTTQPHTAQLTAAGAAAEARKTQMTPSPSSSVAATPSSGKTIAPKASRTPEDQAAAKMRADAAEKRKIAGAPASMSDAESTVLSDAAAMFNNAEKNATQADARARAADAAKERAQTTTPKQRTVRFSEPISTTREFKKEGVAPDQTITPASTTSSAQRPATAQAQGAWVKPPAVTPTPLTDASSTQRTAMTLGKAEIKRLDTQNAQDKAADAARAQAKAKAEAEAADAKVEAEIAAGRKEVETIRQALPEDISGLINETLATNNSVREQLLGLVTRTGSNESSGDLWVRGKHACNIIRDFYEKTNLPGNIELKLVEVEKKLNRLKDNGLIFENSEVPASTQADRAEKNRTKRQKRKEKKAAIREVNMATAPVLFPTSIKNLTTRAIQIINAKQFGDGYLALSEGSRADTSQNPIAVELANLQKAAYGNNITPMIESGEKALKLVRENIKPLPDDLQAKITELTTNITNLKKLQEKRQKDPD